MTQEFEDLSPEEQADQLEAEREVEAEDAGFAWEALQTAQLRQTRTGAKRVYLKADELEVVERALWTYACSFDSETDER